MWWRSSVKVPNIFCKHTLALELKCLFIQINLDITTIWHFKKIFLSLYCLPNNNPQVFKVLRCFIFNSYLSHSIFGAANVAQYSCLLAYSTSITASLTSFFSPATLDASDQPSMSSLMKNIVAKDGFFGLYRGILPNFMKVIPAVSISYVVYEYMKTGLGISKWCWKNISEQKEHVLYLSDLEKKMPEISPRQTWNIQSMTSTSWHASSVDGKLYVSHWGLSVSS